MKWILLVPICLSTISFGQIVKSMKRLPDTGQNTSYTSTFGEDNDFSINAPFFIDNGDGTITDTITGLMWQKLDGGEMTIENAVIYSDTLTLSGYTDWRLPTAQEGFSILNHQNVNPSIDQNVFSLTLAEYWWTSEFQANDPTKVWVTNSGGGVGNHPKNETISAGGTKRFHVRAVRSVSIPETVTNHFTDNGDGTITDNLTGLIWQKTPYADTMSWENALAFADSLVIANKTEWRLPNIKELQSINDETKFNPSLDNNVFSSGNQKKFWSSTTLPNHTTWAWYMHSQFGITTYSDKILRNYVMCVHSPIESTQGIIEFDNTNFQVYPNPFKNHINLKVNGLSNAKLIDNTGSIIYEGGDIEKIDFSFLNKGIYFLVEKGNVIKLVKD